MSRAAVGVFTAAAAAAAGVLLSEKVNAESICLESDGVSDAVVNRVTLTTAAL